MKLRYVLKIAPLLLLVFFLAACGEEEDGAPHILGQGFFMSGGEQFHGTSSLDCQDCHGGTIGNCTRCHFGPDGSRVPEGVDWVHGTVPHNDPALVAEEAVCNKCHGMTRKYIDVPASCHDCH